MVDKVFEIFDCLPYMVLVTGTDGTCVWCNTHAERLFLGSQTGTHISDIFPNQQDLMNALQQATKVGIGVRVQMQHMPIPHMENGQNLVFVSPYGRYLILSIMDIPMLNQGVNAYLHRLVAMLAHEIKNPLSGIRGASQLLDTGEEGSLASLITQETDRISNLVNDLENLSELKNISFAPHNIHQVLDSVILLAQSGVANDCDIIKQYDPSLPPVWGEKDRLLQVFLNLIKNASEAMTGQKEQKIIIRTSYAQGIYLSIKNAQHRAIRVDVQDVGCGISDVEKHNIFAPYITHKMGGKGLGLSVVSNIISSHGGRISFDTSPQGTVFSIILPMANSDLYAYSQNKKLKQ